MVGIKLRPHTTRERVADSDEDQRVRIDIAFAVNGRFVAPTADGAACWLDL